MTYWRKERVILAVKTDICASDTRWIGISAIDILTEGQPRTCKSTWDTVTWNGEQHDYEQTYKQGMRYSWSRFECKFWVKITASCSWDPRSTCNHGQATRSHLGRHARSRCCPSHARGTVGVFCISGGRSRMRDAVLCTRSNSWTTDKKSWGNWLLQIDFTHLESVFYN